MTVVDYEVELDYGDEDLDAADTIPGPADIERWVVEGMRRDGLTPAAVNANRL